MNPRPIVAIISNALAPYRLALHRRIVREIPEIQLASVFTHGESNAPWKARPPVDINPVEFGPGELASDQSRLRFAFHEWRKGGLLVRWLQEHRVRAVVVLGYNDLGRLRIIRWCHQRGIPVFVWADSNIHGDRATGVKRWVKRRYLSWVLSLCTGVMPCGSLGEAYFARYGVPVEKMYRFTLEPDYELIRAISPADVDQVRQGFGLDPQRRRIVYSGRLSPVKRVDLLLDAFAAVAADRPNWDLTIAGTGPLEVALKSRVPAALAARVRWLGFIDDSAVLAALYKACHLMVLPSDFEPWAVAVNEAAAAGLALVCSDVVGAAPELVRDGVNGFTFPRGDLVALTERLREVTQPGRAESFGLASLAVLADWRSRADAVVGLRSALRTVRVLE
jgi:glycosyltransferase involved in cell wall biosynthesis